MHTNYQNKYWAYEVLAEGGDDGLGNISGSISSSNIDLNPHQIQAAMFALRSPVSKGVILADEVGLGKTIEAGLVLSEYFLRGKQKLIIICPAALRKQWERELEDKFDIPTRLLDSGVYDYFLKQHKNPLDFNGCIICSYNFAASMKREIKAQKFDLATIDEAHALRNLYKGKTVIADSLYSAFSETKKLLLTATPIQNSLMDIFSLVSFIDNTIFGNEYSFIENYFGSERRHKDLRRRLAPVLHRTLRKDVLEYIKYTERHAITVSFNPTPEEERLYHLISAYIGSRARYGIKTRFRTLIVLMIRKLMASSTSAVKGTLEGIRARLEAEKGKVKRVYDLAALVGDSDLLEEYKEEFEEYSEIPVILSEPQDIKGIDEEIGYLNKLIKLAEQIKVDGKTEKLITALEMGFKQNKGPRKAIIFTESHRTLEYLFKYLSAHGFKNKIVTFSGSNDSPLCNKIYEDYKLKNPLTLSGIKSADMRQALIDKFKNDAEIMIATEAGAEGLNLQFCSMLVNYDLPWNPQRVEQRIGRVHRYGQQNDVVIINFINKSNIADVRLYDILQHKFKLFDGVFGASDEILGSLSDGIDFERAVADIFENCRTPQAIEAAFDELQRQLGEEKEKTMDDTKQLVLDFMTPTIAEKFKLIKTSIDEYLERRKKVFWALTKNLLDKKYFINEASRTFGEFKEQVFEEYSDRKFAFNFSHRLDFSGKGDIAFTKRDKRQQRLKPQPYNPTTDFGKSIIKNGLSLPTTNAHLIVKGLGKSRGLVRVSVYKRTNPGETHKIITTFIGEGGTELKINPADFFDNIVETQDFAKPRFEDMLNYIHDKKVKSIATKDKRAIEDILKQEVEKLNRWAYEEKNSIKYQIKGLEGKLNAIKKKYKNEKVLAEKIKVGIEIEELQNKISDLQTNAFEKQGDVDKKAKNLIAGRKRALKHEAEIQEVMFCSFAVE